MKVNFLENFIGKYFLKMPGPIRWFVYLLFVLLFIHNYLKPTPFGGQMWIKQKDGTQRAASDYIIRHGDNVFAVNSHGRWVLFSDRKMPGYITPVITDHLGKWVGEVKLSVPIPIYSAIIPPDSSIIYNESDGTIKVSKAELSGIVFCVKAYAQPPPPPPIKKLYIKIKQLTLKESGDSRSEGGQLYFKIFVDGREIKQPGIPDRNYPSTYLLINDNTTTKFRDLIFEVPDMKPNFSSFKLTIQIFDRDYRFLFWRSKDDMVGSFEIELTQNNVGKEVSIKTGELPRFRGENSSIVIELATI